MASKRPVSNPLALAVLACLREAPMHPYQMATTMRERGKEHSIKLNYGSLYTVVNNLVRHGLIEPAGADREGGRPERTVYRLTSAGSAELTDWMRELLAVPVKEYPQFEAALTLLAVLPPDEVVSLLRQRMETTAKELAGLEQLIAAVTADLPRLWLIEGEYYIAMRRAELEWVAGLVTEIEDGTLDGIELWRSFQSERAAGGQEESQTPD